MEMSPARGHRGRWSSGDGFEGQGDLHGDWRRSYVIVDLVVPKAVDLEDYVLPRFHPSVDFVPRLDRLDGTGGRCQGGARALSALKYLVQADFYLVSSGPIQGEAEIGFPLVAHRLRFAHVFATLNERGAEQLCCLGLKLLEEIVCDLLA